MTSLNFFRNAFLCLVIMTASFSSSGGVANASKTAHVAIEDGWVRATIASSRVSASYFTIKNLSQEALILQAVSSSVGKAEIHESKMHDGIMKMEEKAALEIPAKQAVHFTPGGLHIMLLDLKEPLEAGKTLNIKLHFKDGQTFEVQLPIRQS